MVTGSAGTEDAKHVLDKFGQQVYEEKVENAAKTYEGELAGQLSLAPILGERASSLDPCVLIKEKHDEFINSKRHPCEKRSPVRFSDESRSQCTHNRIKDSQEGDNDVGACAPFRRLSVCDYNLEKMGRTSTTKHDLLAEVCMAAYYEAESLINYRAQYDAEHHDTGFTTCTMLARSFADIGDIVRGKDLYLGDKKKKQNGKKTETEREKLEQKLKDIFAKIHSDVTRGRTKVAEELQERYKKDPDFFKLREDWWTANRATVWKAITCNAGGSQYFRKTCGSDEKTATRAIHQCRCKDKKTGSNADPPTYFDYVPQYLRWFEEWAEDFCRKRKHKLENAKEQCRDKGEDGDDRYCSRNGYDCTRTIRGINKLVEGDCTKCSVVCTPFVDWIDNKKKEFEKQKEKYDKEIQKKEDKTTTKETSNGPINNLYVGDFYEKLEKQYKSVQTFLELLNKETTCEKHPEVGEEKKTSINFNDKIDEIFSHTEYCETCPWCATKKKQNEKWENEEHKEECKNYLMKTIDESKSTEIKLLVKDKDGKTMVEKLGGLCGNGAKKNNIQEKTWKCYYQKEDQINGILRSNDCILQDKNKDNLQQRTIHSFNSLFWQWVTEMFEDSIKWRTEYKNCINNNNTCISGCKSKCECFQKWVERKTKEWQQVKDHYVKEEFKLFGPYGALELNLYLSYFPKIKAPYEKVISVQEFIKEMQRINEENSKDIRKCTEENNSINELLKKEKEIATKCLQKQEECKKKKQQENLARSQTNDPRAQSPAARSPATGDHELSDDEEEEEEEEPPAVDGEKGDTEDHSNDQGETTQITTQDGVKPPCDIVKELFSNRDNTFKDACDLKYNKGKHYGWRCIPTEKTSDSNTRESSLSGGEAKRQRRNASDDPTTGKSGATTGSATTGGSICVPPRRRKLYVTPLTKWATNTVETQVGGGEAQALSGQVAAQSNSSSSDSSRGSTQALTPSPSSHLRAGDAALRDAFIQSAAVETFFLWHKYKAENTKRQGDGSQLQTIIGVTLENSGEQTPEEQLASGKIPPDFLRQMFYTLGDYRDIAVRGVADDTNGVDTNSDKTNIVLLASGTEEEKAKMKQIQKKIKDIVQKPNGPHALPPTSDKKREEFWTKYGPHIWNGMVCALTYEDNGPKGQTPTQNEQVKEKLLDDSGKKPKGKYSDYKTVKLDENSGTEDPKPNDDPINNPKLKNFVEIPTYFRWLHEWGNSFCFERAKRLAQIKKDCNVEENDNRRGGVIKRQYSGDGEECSEIVENKDKIFKDLEGRSCSISCSSYRKWIKGKKTQYEKQKDRYKTERDQAKSDNGVCGTLGTCNEAKDFLGKLGSCSKTNNGGSTIEFKDTDKTFGHDNYCDPCSEFTVKLENCNCTEPAKGKGCNGGKMKADDIKNKTDVNGNIDMLVSDDSTTEFKGNGLQQACKGKGIFEGIRKDEWKCGEICGYNVCGLKKGDNNDIDDKQIILIRAFLKRWLEYFFEDYNRIQKKLKACIKNGNGEEQKCYKGCKENCECVGQWIEKKKEEWENIRKQYVENYEKENKDGNNLNSFLEQTPFKNEIDKAIKPCDFDNFKKSCGLNGADRSEKGKKDEDYDLVKCLLDRLKQKIDKCKQKHAPTSDNSCSTLDNTTPSLEDEDLLLEETENPVGKQQPSFCPAPVEDKKKVVEDEDTCTPATTTPKEPAPTTPKKPAPPADSPLPSTPSARPNHDQPPPAQPAPLPPPPEVDPLPAREPFDSTILQTTIPFGIAIALTSIVFLFLK
ncbi:hypothetical protein PFAG_05992, partial [Plasmodium falciparum Santa Lucia]